MATYALRRLLLAVPVLIGITAATFAFLNITGDPCAALLGERYTQARCDEIRDRYGLEKPLVVRYALYVATIAQGDLGRSIITKRPVASELVERFPATAELALAAMIVAVLVGIPLGIISAARHNTAVDLGAMVVALIGVSMPVFWLGLMLAWFFGFRMGWFPTSGRLSAGLDPASLDILGHTVQTNLVVLDAVLARDWPVLRDALHHLVLPAAALGTIPAAIIARITRSSMLDVLRQDYIRTARAKGLVEHKVIARHALANALLPVVTVVGLQTGFLLSGAVLTETIFAWPGMGQWVVKAIPANDIPVVQGAVLVFAGVFVLVNLVVDLSYAWLDPRIHYR